MNKQDNLIIFDSDDEITDYCINPIATIQYVEVDGKNIPYYTHDFTQQCIDDINNSVMYKVNDPESKVMKRGCVTRGVISKKLSNLCNE